jgi:zinc transport system substrate-binding protein
MRGLSPSAIFLILFVLCGCRQTKPAGQSAAQAEGKINVSSVIFPFYDFVRAIAGDKVHDRVNLVMLLPPGTESHSYEPSPRDIITISKSDLFIYSGGENSRWIDRILESAKSPESKMIVLAFDEHSWTSPKNAGLIVAAIAQALCDLDSASAEFYRQNAAEYTARLEELDASFRSIADGAKRKTIIFGDRFPFSHLADAYGLESFAAFPGCSDDTEPSAATVAFLINKVKTEQIPVVFHIELSNEKMADTICEAAGAKKLLLHSCHNITRKDFENGVSYLELQKLNAQHLREALW